MAGHSKFKNIMHRKGRQDAKRAKIFAKLGKELSVAARSGTDPDFNPRLRLAISAAKAQNMPNDNIQRAIKRAEGNDNIIYEEVRYEGYGPGGIAILMDIITDNKNRSVAEIRHTLSKFSGNLGENGSVSWMFDKTGQIILASTTEDEDRALEAAIDVGANDFQSGEDIYLVSTDVDSLMEVRDNLEGLGYDIKSAEIEMTPKTTQKLKEKESELVMRLLEALEDNDDVNKLYTNFDFD